MAKKEDIKNNDVNYYLVPEDLIIYIYNYLNTRPRKEVNNLAVAMEQLKKTETK